MQTRSHPKAINKRASITLLVGAAVVIQAAGTSALADVERYKIESEYLARLAELNLEIVFEGFESSVWDETRTTIVDPHLLPEVTSQSVLWEPAAKDVFGAQYSNRQHGLSTTPNWARSGGWGMYENHVGEPYPTTIRISTAVPIFGVGGWFNTNPDGQSVGVLFEDRTAANEPGYFLPGYGAMYPGDNPSFGHEFIGFIDPAGFNAVVLTGTLQVNEKGTLEGGTIFGCDDFTLAVPAGFITPPCPADINNDSVIDTADLGQLISDFGTNAPTSDINTDGIVDTADLGILIAEFGFACL